MPKTEAHCIGCETFETEVSLKATLNRNTAKFCTYSKQTVDNLFYSQKL